MKRLDENLSIDRVEIHFSGEEQVTVLPSEAESSRAAQERQSVSSESIQPPLESTYV